MPYQPIENHGVIGDMKTIALVGMDGTIDFFCFPAFDSPSAFASLLDDKKGGGFGIAMDLDDMRQNQLYVPDTNVLITRFMSHKGILEVTDFMPIGEDDAPSQIVRIIRTVQGSVPVRLHCKPAFDYGRQAHELTLDGDGTSALFAGPDGQSLRLRTTMKMTDADGGATARFTLKAGEWACAVLGCGRDAENESAFSEQAIQALHDETIRYWRIWVEQITYKGRWRNILHRSALVLKLMTVRQTGAIIAAPTFGLPEAIGGARNWDYRYCWIRDSAFTVYAFIRLGLKQEAIAFMQWVEKLYKDSADKQGRLQVMYKIDGGREIAESTLDHFDGYKGTKPVRIGNDAYRQFQLDLYGELLDAMSLADNHITKISYDAWQNVIKTADYVCENWQEPDAGIWEFRGESREFLHSRLMCWVALDRALRLARRESLPAEVARWLDVRAEIYNDIFTNFWSDELQSFVQYKGAGVVDASVLLMPLVDFIGPHDPRWVSTLKVVGDHLACDALVYRYRIEDSDLDLIDGRHEGSFNACSFWYIACLARGGRMDEAWLLFSKMISYANHLGLYAEETGDNGHQLGNFPQAFTHLALINAVFALEEMSRTERTETE